MKHYLDWVIAIEIALAGTGLLAQRSQQEHIAMGYRIFKSSCSVCHSLIPHVNKNGPSLSGVMRDHRPASSEERVRQIIAEGKGTMPAFSDRLSPDEISALIRFLRSQ